MLHAIGADLVAAVWLLGPATVVMAAVTHRYAI